MISRGYGRIINIASLSTYVGLFEVAAYSASKAAVGALTKVLAEEWSRHGVLVNAIAPGVFRTDLNANLLDSTERGREFKMRTPIGRFGKTEELVGAAVYLASDAAYYIWARYLSLTAAFSPAESTNSDGVQKARPDRSQPLGSGLWHCNLGKFSATSTPVRRYGQFTLLSKAASISWIRRPTTEPRSQKQAGGVVAGPARTRHPGD